MQVPFDIGDFFGKQLENLAVGRLEFGDFRPEVRPAEAQHGDFQANGALGYAKAHRLNPRQVAETIVAALPAEIREACDVAIAGPGFINFKLKPAALLEWLKIYDSETHLKTGASEFYRGHRQVVDFSSPNTAKQLHVGHIRSMVIGECLCRLLEFCGASVVRDNHIGDWGTQFGKLIWAYKKADPAALESALVRDPLEEFERLYKTGNAAAESDPAVLREAQQELVKLQAGDPENRAIWKKINDASLTAFEQIYRRLGIHFDVTLGESFYNDKVERIYRELTECGLAAESEGALVVFHPEHPRFKTQPFIVRKSDGASNYATTDLATMLYRVEHFHADTVVILTDTRQNDHFEQLWLTTKKWFEKKGYPLPLFEHVSFGSILGEDGKAIKTRSGEPIKLKALLDEAEERAFRIVTEKSPDLSEAERRDIARAIGIGAVQYADLSQNRSSDYVFDWQKILSFDGNTAPYLLYAVTRIYSIFKKAGSTPEGVAVAEASAFETPEELALARKLIGFAATLRLTATQLRPHFLCIYLYELAGEFSTFYNANKVIVDSPAVRSRRLLLCARTLLILETGLRLLGLRTLQRM